MGTIHMDAYRLILTERTDIAKGIARTSPTTENLTAYGRAIMNGWDGKLLVATQMREHWSDKFRTYPPADV